jgi:hypothetical protein
MRSPIQFLLVAASAFLAAAGVLPAREWTDKSGQFKVGGTLVAYDDVEITLKLDQKSKGHELLAIPIQQLSEADRQYLQSEEVKLTLDASESKHTWTLRNGLKVIAKVVDFAKQDVVIQRRRGKIFVNDQLLEAMPEVYQRMVPRIVEHFEHRTLPNDKAFQDWMKEQKANARTFTCEGVVLEFPNGEEFAFPFFLFADSDRALMEPGWQQWEKSTAEAEEQRQHSLYLQSQAAAYQQSQQQQMKMARLQLQLQAVTAGVTDMWEVYLEPGPNIRGYPISVAVYARNSEAAEINALSRNPGYVVGYARKLAGRY